MTEQQKTDAALPKTPASKAPDDYFAEWRSKPSPTTLSPLITSLDPIVDKAMRSYGYTGDPNIKQTARIHIMRSLPRFDPSKSKLETFTFNELKRLQRLGPRQEHPIPIPEQASFDIRSVQNAEVELKDELGRDPTSHELADRTGLSLKRLSRLRTYGRPTVTENVFEDESGAVTPVGSPADSMDQVWTEAIYLGLSPVDQKIMDWSMGSHGEQVLSKTEMSQRLGMSVSAVTQRARRIADKLSEGSEYMLWQTRQ
jgi:DNA-directed RNA polymerase specialized sigma subunit